MDHLIDNMTVAECFDLFVSNPKFSVFVFGISFVAVGFWIAYDGLIYLFGRFVLPKLESFCRCWREKRKADKS